MRVAAAPAVTTSRPTSRSSRSNPLAPSTRTRWIDGSWLAIWRAVARADDTTVSGVTGAPIAGQPRDVVGPIVHRVVRHVDDVVAPGRAVRQDFRDAGYWLLAAIDDAVEIDEQQQTHPPIVPPRSHAPPGARRPPATMPPMAHKSADPLASTEWLLVDGTNLLHALSKSTVAAPRGALIGRLRGVVPAGDRHRSSSSTDPRNPASAASGSRPGYGSATAAVARPTTSCSDWSMRRARPTARRARPRSSWSPTTATCATPCSSRAPEPRGRRGSSVASTGRRHDPPGPVLPRRGAHLAPIDGDDDDGPRWEPGRGATVKKGNPRKAPRADRG